MSISKQKSLLSISDEFQAFYILKKLDFTFSLKEYVKQTDLIEFEINSPHSKQGKKEYLLYVKDVNRLLEKILNS